MNSAPAIHPTWDSAIAALFKSPYWIPEQSRAGIGLWWISSMKAYLIDLDDCASVAQWGVTIYDHLYSRSMPLTNDTSQFWPDEALALLANWINEGCRENEQAPLQSLDLIRARPPRPAPLRVRQDLRDLSEQDLAIYRMKLDDLMRVGDASAASPWQQLAYIHTNWCLHYQEAFLPWHRASLLYFEQLIDFPIPYWNWYAADASVDGSPDAGIPQAFKDETYIHPLSGEVRPNPLRYAAAKDGRSKACPGPQPAAEACRWVQRDPLLYTVGDERRAERQKKIAMVELFQRQVQNALTWPSFSQPQGHPGYPWANIPVFKPPQPDEDYPHREDFDGLYEQPHDNFHGWIGADMADNSYTAFDPIFWSYHANIDRIMEVWLAGHPDAAFSARVPIQPFIGPSAAAVDFTERNRYRYTTIGDMVKDAGSLGYRYAPPHSPDFQAPLRAAGTAMGPALYVVFNEVRCTFDSYAIDAFLDLDAPGLADVDAANPHYVGRLMRLGMGVIDDKGRCVKKGVTRVLDASLNAQRLQLSAESAPHLAVLVTEMASGKVLPEEEWRKLPGFAGRLVWGGAAALPPASAAAAATSCCMKPA